MKTVTSSTDDAPPPRRPSTFRGGGDLAARLKQAVALYGNGYLQQAGDACRRLLDAHPGQADALNLGGVIELQLGNHENAVRLLRLASATRPDHAETHTNLGAALQAAGNLEDAVRSYQRAIEIKPAYAHALSNLGAVYQSMGSLEDALVAHRQAIELKPDFADGHNNMGNTLQALGRVPEAEECYRLAIEHRPHHAGTWRNLARALQSIGELDAAQSALSQAKDFDPDHAGTHNSLGIVIQKMGRPEDAARSFRRALELDPAYADAHANLGISLYRQDDPAPAAESFARALEAGPDRPLARFYLAVLLEEMGETEKASHHFTALEASAANARFLIDSWNYAKENRLPQTRFFSTSFETLDFGLQIAGGKGLVLEFGARFGASLRFIANLANQEVHGFDAFEQRPEVSEKTHLHDGPLADTLLAFAEKHRGPVRFMNMNRGDFDSVETVFHCLGDRIISGTVVVFNQYFMTEGWRDNQQRAFREAVEKYGWQYETLAFNLFTRQAVVRIG